jgi:hypothetical protein
MRLFTFTFTFFFSITLSQAQLTINDLNPGDLIITEIMYDPKVVADNLGEWFEIYNVNAAESFNLNGMIVQDAAANQFTISSDLIIAPGGYLVFCISGDIAVNGGVVADYVYGSSMALNNGGDEIILKGPSTIIDAVDYSFSNFPDPSGASIYLHPYSYDVTSNDDGANWLVSSTPYGDGDLGTPESNNRSTNLNGLLIDQGIRILSNPVGQVLEVELERASYGRLSLINLAGSTVFSKPLQGKILQYNVSHLKDGIYILVVNANGDVHRRKIIINND